MASSAKNPALDARAASEAAGAIASEEAAEQAARAAISSKVSLRSGDGRDALNAEWSARVSPFLRALGDPTRLNIVLLLQEHGELDVATLVKKLGLGQGTVSEALARLKHERLVFHIRDAKRHVYRLNQTYLSWKMDQISKRIAGK